VAVFQFAGGLEELVGGLDVEVDEIEPADVGGAHAAGGAVEDNVGLDVEDGLLELRSVEHIDLADLDVGAGGEERWIGGAHEEDDPGARVGRGEQMHDVVAEGSGCSSDEHFRGVQREHVESSLS
jgi:hypothetical protein